jgi:hypothetical protein
MPKASCKKYTLKQNPQKTTVPNLPSCIHPIIFGEAVSKNPEGGRLD